jgi:hypothetical protein
MEEERLKLTASGFPVLIRVRVGAAVGRSRTPEAAQLLAEAGLDVPGRIDDGVYTRHQYTEIDDDGTVIRVPAREWVDVLLTSVTSEAASEVV